MSTTVRISTEAKKRFAEIRKENGQFTTDAQLFDHILYVYDEQRFKPEKGIVQTSHIISGNPTSPIQVIGVGGKEFVQIGGQKL